MLHNELIKLAQAFGYTSITDGGLCHGFAMMWSQAVCANDLDSFKQRMDLLDNYKSDPAALVSRIEEIRTKIVNKDYLPTDENYGLTEEELKLLEIPAFFDGIALYLRPAEHLDFFDEPRKMHQVNIEPISRHTAPYGDIPMTDDIATKETGLKNTFCTVDQYNKHELETFLLELEKKLEGRSDIAIAFSSINHVVSARYLGDGKFEFIDTNLNVHNSMTHLTLNAKELSENIFLALTNENIDFLPLACTVIRSANTPEIDFESCRNREPINTLHANQNNNTTLHLAAYYNDLALIDRINFQSKKIDINQKDANNVSAPFLMLTSQNYDAFQKILDLPGQSLAHDSKEILHYLVCNSEDERVLELASLFLNKEGISPNTESGSYWSPLHIACSKNDDNMVKLLLDKGADVNRHCSALNGSPNGPTPLHVSAMNGNNKEIIELLINRGADCNIKDENERKAFDLALDAGHEKIAEILLDKTTLEASSFGKTWSLKSMDCSPNMKKKILIKGLEDYIKQRHEESNFGNILRLGYSQKEKITAANALITHLNNPESAPLSTQNIKVLQNARLGNIYRQHQELNGGGNNKTMEFKSRLAQQKNASNPSPEPAPSETLASRSPVPR